MHDPGTIYELSPVLYGRVSNLFDVVHFDRAQIGAVLEGRQAGRVFVDDPLHPSAALMTRTYGFYLSGNPECAALREFIADAPAEANAFD